MAAGASDIVFLVPGQAGAAAPAGALERGRVKAAVRVGATRSGGEPVRVAARPGEDIVVLDIANGPTLILHPQDALDLMRAQAAAPARGAAAAAPNEVVVPAQLGWPGLEAQAMRGATRGWMGQALLTGFHVLTGLARDPADALAAAAITRRVDGGVDAGVYRLAAEALGPLKGSGRRLDAVPAAGDGGPLLVLVHGTFSDTAGTFGKLWTLHNTVVRRIFSRYADRVYGLDHPTLGASPIANALLLVRALPAGARLHLLTHSRGGLVAEILARACAGGLTNESLALFADLRYAQHRSDLRALVEAAQAKALRVERVVRVACPARGTLLASKRLDAYLSILAWCLGLAGIPVAPLFVDFLHEVARRRADPGELPGLEAMLPGSPVIEWLNGAGGPIPGELRVVAGDVAADSIGAWVKTLLADAFYWTDNDFVVQTRSMYGGAPRAGSAQWSGARFLLDRGGKVSHFSYFSNDRTVAAIAAALEDDAPEGFAPIGPLSSAGEDAGGTRAAAVPAGGEGAAPAPFRSAGERRQGFVADNTARIAVPGSWHLEAVPRALDPRAALPVSVLNSDLKFVHQPLLVGHYRSIGLSGTEAVVDGLVAAAMSKSLAAGLYPDAVGSHQIFGNLRKDPQNVLAMARPLAVVVAGLGEEGKLRAADLALTVRQAVLAYAQRLGEQAAGAPVEFEMAAALLGSGGTGVTAGSAAQAIAQGAYDANVKLRESGWPKVSRLVLVELYLDRATDAWRALQVQETASPHQLELLGPVLAGAGALRRSLDSSYRGAAYDFISVVTSPPVDGVPGLAYNLDTRRARTEVRAQRAQGTLVRELVAKASNDTGDTRIGRTLFDLLVPVELEPFLGGTSEMVIELDAGTAAIPWELLDTPGSQAAGGDGRPWALRCKLLRKLRTEDFRSEVSDTSADGSALVIGAPLVDDPLYPPLPGALAEAIAVAGSLGAAGLDPARVCALTGGEDDAHAIVNALFARPYRIVHVAGHGAPGSRGGVVLSGNTFLGPDEVQAMRAVPELVFLNCCYLAAHDAQTTLVPYDRASFAANIADALIRIGVRCVVAAGWAVEDAPAKLFATTFYDVLLAGGRFIDAVAAARAAAWRDGGAGNTWAAYQCYGDPGWTWQRDGDPRQGPAVPLAEEFTAVSSPPALALALETISIRLRFGGEATRSGSPLQAQLDKIRFLEARFAPLWGGMGAVAEAFGLAFADARDLDKAIEWYRVAVAAPDGSASFRAAEQLGNQLARRGEAAADRVGGRRDVEEAIVRLHRLVDLQPTAEREALLGSAYKRLVMIEGRAATPGRAAAAARRRGASGAAGERLAALRAMALHYGHAEEMARASDADNLFYPAKNGISAELRLAFLERRPAEIAVDRIEAVRESLERAATERPDFWSVVGQIELRLLTALAAQQLAAAAPGLIEAFRDLKARVRAPGMWDSVHAEARFTLEPYSGVAAAAEKKAAAAVLGVLQALATAT